MENATQKNYTAAYTCQHGFTSVTRTFSTIGGSTAVYSSDNVLIARQRNYAFFCWRLILPTPNIQTPNPNPTYPHIKTQDVRSKSYQARPTAIHQDFHEALTRA